MYAGVGTLSRQLRAAGFSTCTLDIVDWNPWIQERILRSRKRTCKGNPLDLTTAAGFAFLSVQLLKFSVFMEVWYPGSCAVLWICHATISSPKVTAGSDFERWAWPCGIHCPDMLHICINLTWIYNARLFPSTWWWNCTICGDFKFACFQDPVCWNLPLLRCQKCHMEMSQTSEWYFWTKQGTSSYGDTWNVIYTDQKSRVMPLLGFFGSPSESWRLHQWHHFESEFNTQRFPWSLKTLPW